MHLRNQGQSALYTTQFERKIVFFLVFMGVVAVTYGLLYLFDFLPEPPKSNEASATVADTVMERDVEEEVIEEYVEPYPVTVIFDSLDNRQVTVLNPISNKIADLDEALLEGVVRHPDSADFQSEGTIFLFGHSSYLPSVINKNFQAFNGIQKLQWGDTVRLQSLDREYVYRVDRVYQAKASDAEVEITRGEAKLTLATCNSFGSKDDRYIVEATLVDSYPLSV